MYVAIKRGKPFYNKEDIAALNIGNIFKALT